jgi:hypothetical protein
LAVGFRTTRFFQEQPMTATPPRLRLARGTVSPEREEIARRVEHFELSIRRRNRSVAMLACVGVMMVLGGLLSLLAGL